MNYLGPDFGPACVALVHSAGIRMGSAFAHLARQVLGTRADGHGTRMARSLWLKGTGEDGRRLVVRIAPPAAHITLLRSENGPQAMDTAMNASKKISTPPTTGKIKGISGTTASTASTSWPGAWDVGADMEIPSMLE